MTDSMRLASDLLDVASRYQHAAVVLPVGRWRGLLVHGAKLIRIVSEQVARGDSSVEVGEAWLTAARFQLRALVREARTS